MLPNIDLTHLKHRVLELFAGIGGFHAACPDANVVAAVDIDQAAGDVYRANWNTPYHNADLSTLSDDFFLQNQADLWWMSPPCQPYTHRGARRDLADPRSQGLIRVLKAIEVFQPHSIALENVAGFEDSEASRLVLATLENLGYHIASLLLCPTQFGWPNRRLRYYLLATKGTIIPWLPLPQIRVDWTRWLESEDRVSDLYLDCSVGERYWKAMDRLNCGESLKPAACFAGSYGKAILRSGSYLETDLGWRRFAPTEVARFLGFPSEYRWPEGIERRKAWSLLGNSLSLPAVAYVLQHLR